MVSKEGSSKKLHQSVDTVIKLLTQLNCVDALPLALMIYHMHANKITHLTLHEMLPGGPMPSPIFRDRKSVV